MIFVACLLQGYSLFAQIQVPGNLPLHRTCGTESPDVVWEKWFSSKVQAFRNSRLAGRPAITSYTIPVIVHVIHGGSAVGVNDNISLAQVQSQIDILNRDYSGINSDIVNVPSEFQSVKSGNTGIQFCLAKQNPNGVALPEYGVDRINWRTRGWNDPNTYPSANSAQALRLLFSDTIKPATIWDPARYLNIWLVQMDNSGMLGWSTFPIGTGMSDITVSLETATTSGVVINEKAWGNIGTAASGNYNLGRTATHEIGHWLGVYHTFQGGCAGTADTTCNNSGDYCCDTPPESTSDFGCPATKNTCTETPVDRNDMTMNFMDYVNDACMFMFTADQATRMQTAMINGTYRVPLKNSVVCNELPPDLSITNVQLSPVSVTAGNIVTATFTIVNNANGNANPNYVNFYLSRDTFLTPGVNGDTLLDQYYVNQQVNALSQTSTLSKQVSIPSNLNTGTYYIFLVADGTGIIGETNENNNNAYTPLSVDFACSPAALPTISAVTSATPVCFNASAQATALTYSATTNSPLTYSIAWSVVPSNNFSSVVNADIPASPIIINVPAGTNPGTYTGTLTVKNANGCVSIGTSFSVTVNPIPTITLASSASARCFSENTQTTSLPYSAVSGSPVTYSIAWNSSPANVFAAVIDSALPVSPVAITIPAGASTGTYSGQLTAKSAAGCVSQGYTFNLVVNPNPAITVAASTANVCSSSGAQATALPYTAVTENPVSYSITWSSSPANSFVAVNNAALTASPVNISVPAGTTPGTYSGTIYVANANGCTSSGSVFTLPVINSQATVIAPDATALPVCFSQAAQVSFLPYTVVSGSPVTYSIAWNSTPANSFTVVADSSLPASPIGIAVPAGTVAGTYTGTIKVKNVYGCSSSGSVFTLAVNPLPAITLAAAAASKCYNASAQTTTLAYSAVSGSPVSYSIAWNSSPVADFIPITDSPLTGSPFIINIPAGTNAGTYTGTLTVKNANGCVSLAKTFTLTVNPLPSIANASSIAGVCSGSTATTTSLPYTAVTGTPVTYSISWSSTPANSFAAVNNAALPVSPLSITVPANTAAATYTGYITVKNANGCISTPNSFTVPVSNNQSTTITLASAALGVCYNAASQSVPLAYTAVSGNPVTYSLTWNSTPANSFAAVTDSALPVSPVNIAVPAATAIGTYTGSIRVKNAYGCISSAYNFTIAVGDYPTITSSSASTNKCFSSSANTTTLTYSAVTGSPNRYSITWNATPSNSFVPVTDAALPSSPITINIPAGANAGTYTGNLKVKTASGCESVASKSFTVKIYALPTIATAISAAGLCYNASAQATTLPYSGYTNSPTTYSLTWNPAPANSFVPVTNSSLPSSPINIAVPAATAGGVYTGYITVKNANSCVSLPNSFTVAVTSLNEIVYDTAVTIVCPGDVVNISGIFDFPGFNRQWSIADPSAVAKGSYKLIVSNGSGCVDSAVIIVQQDIEEWLGSASSNWHDPLNWSDKKVPGDSTHVILIGQQPNICTISSGDAAVASVQLLKGAQLAISDNNKLLVYNYGCDSLPAPVIAFPEIITTPVSGVTQNSVTTGGYVSGIPANPVTEKGVCISTATFPDISGKHTTDGSGTGNFTAVFTTLAANTTYYIRAYATTADGTVYGDQIIFSTLP